MTIISISTADCVHCSLLANWNGCGIMNLKNGKFFEKCKDKQMVHIILINLFSDLMNSFGRKPISDWNSNEWMLEKSTI